MPQLTSGALGAQQSEVTVSIAAVVFDLADVLLEFGGVASVSRLSPGRIGAAEFSRLWQSSVADRFYRGLCTPNEFAAAAVAELGLPVGPEAFLEEFRTWLRGPYPRGLRVAGGGPQAGGSVPEQHQRSGRRY